MNYIKEELTFECSEVLSTSMDEEKKLVLSEDEIKKLRLAMEKLDEFQQKCQEALVRDNIELSWNSAYYICIRLWVRFMFWIIIFKVVFCHSSRAEWVCGFFDGISFCMPWENFTCNLINMILSKLALTNGWRWKHSILALETLYGCQDTLIKLTKLSSLKIVNFQLVYF